MIEPSAEFRERIKFNTGSDLFEFSAVDKRNYEDLIKLIKDTIPEHSYKTPALLGDLISQGDIVILNNTD